MAAPGRDCSTTMYSCFTKSGSLLPSGQWTWAQRLSERHVPLTGKPLAFSESSLRDFMCSSRMIPTVSQRVGGRSEGKALTIVPYKDVDINLELTASEGDGGTWN